MLSRTRWIRDSLPFFLPAYLYIWLVIEPHLIYHGFGTTVFNATVFSTQWSFLRESFSAPGGAVSYVGGFLSQGYYYSWLGALIIVVTAWCLCGLSRRHLVCAGHARAAVSASLAAVIVFLMVSRYKQPMAACLAVSLGLIFSLVFERLPLHSGPVRVAVYCLMAAVNFWLAGTGGLLVFAPMTVVYGILVHRDWWVVVLAIPAGVAITWGLAEYLFVLSPRQAFLILTPFSDPLTAGMNTFFRGLLLLLYGFVPVTLSLVGLGTMVLHKTGQSSKGRSGTEKRRKGHASASQEKTSRVIFKRLAGSGAAVLVTAIGLYFTYNAMDKVFMLSNYYCRQKQWAKILELAGHLPKGMSNVYFNHDLNRALFHTGRMPYEMFRFPQRVSALMLTHEEKESSLTELQLCDAFMELGEVNTAEKLASEVLVAEGNLGIVLEKLAWIHIIKGERDTARVYLDTLKGDVIYRGTAEAMLKGLERGFKPDQAAYVERLRSYMRRDTGPSGKLVDVELSQLLEHNSHNRMAFEYLMACYLLTGQLDKVMANIDRLGQFGYPDIPTHYEEAILLYYGSRGQRVDIRKFPIRQETLQRYVRFVQINNSMRPDNLQATLNQLGRELGDSYFFYYRVQCGGQGKRL